MRVPYSPWLALQSECLENLHNGVGSSRARPLVPAWYLYLANGKEVSYNVDSSIIIRIIWTSRAMPPLSVWLLLSSTD